MWPPTYDAAVSASPHSGTIVRRTEGAGRVASTATDEEGDLPRVAALHQNRPNPFNPSTSIGFDLPQESAALLTIRTADGRVVRTLIDGRVSAGRRQIVWDGRDDHGRPAASGVYFYKLSAGAFQASRRLVLLK